MICSKRASFSPALTEVGWYYPDECSAAYLHPTTAIFLQDRRSIGCPCGPPSSHLALLGPWSLRHHKKLCLRRAFRLASPRSASIISGQGLNWTQTGISHREKTPTRS